MPRNHGAVHFRGRPRPIARSIDAGRQLALAKTVAESRRPGDNRPGKEASMAKNGWRVMDSDLHVVEPRTLWEDYLDPKFRGRIVTVPGDYGAVRAHVDGRVLPPYADSPEASARGRSGTSAPAPSGCTAAASRRKRSRPWTPRASTSASCSARGRRRPSTSTGWSRRSPRP